MENILVISGHTDLEDSVANKAILDELEKSLKNKAIRYLDKLYKDYKIDRAKEQEELIKADIIMLVFPLFWFSMPSLMHKYFEEVFTHGFSHGSTGDKLKGKKLIASVTTGAEESAYLKENKESKIDDFLIPLKTTCAFTGMQYMGYVFTGGVSYQTRINEEKIAEIKEKAKLHAKRLIDMI